MYSTGYTFPRGPSTEYLRILVPECIEGMASGTRSLKYRALGPSGFGTNTPILTQRAQVCRMPRALPAALISMTHSLV